MFDKLCTQQIHLIEAVTLLSEYVQVQMQNGPGRYIRFSAWVEETERGNRKEIERGNRKREHKEEIEKKSPLFGVILIMCLAKWSRHSRLSTNLCPWCSRSILTTIFSKPSFLVIQHSSSRRNFASATSVCFFFSNHDIL